MKTQYLKEKWLGLSLVGALMLSGCGASKSKPEESGNRAGSTPNAAAVPESKNSDGSVAPTRQPSEGFGNAIGRVIYNGAGAKGIEV